MTYQRLQQLCTSTQADHRGYEKYDRALKNAHRIKLTAGDVSTKCWRRRLYWFGQVKRALRRINRTKPYQSLNPRFRKFNRRLARVQTLWHFGADKAYAGVFDKVGL